MKLFSALYLLLIALNYSVVDEFHLLVNEKQELIFLETYKDSEDPVVQGYICAVEMKQAEYASNPFTKLKIFKKTKNKLNNLLEKNPSNVDLRYLRLLLQERTPSILGYNDYIEEDKRFLKSKLEAKEIRKDLQKYIYKNTSL